MGVTPNRYKRKNKHGRKGVPKSRPITTLSMDEQAQIYRDAWKDGYRTGLQEAGDKSSKLLRSLLSIDKKTDIHHRIREFLEGKK